MRLLFLGNVVIDLVLEVPGLPPRGGDLLAAAAHSTAGGGFNVMAAAARQGLPTAYGGPHGTGPFADLARAALAAEGIDVLQPPAPDRDTGVVIAMVDPGGERTFVTAPGAEATPDPAALAAIRPAPGDIIALSGYTLAHPASRAALLPWLRALPPRPPGSPQAGRPRCDGPGAGDWPAGLVVFDPGPLTGPIPPDALAAVLSRTDWLTCNSREATMLSGLADPAGAARGLVARLPAGAGVIVRVGPDGCLVCNGGDLTAVPGFEVRAVDTNGAGDTHTGTFVAALASGLAPAAAARRANAAAALSVTRRGPATAPTPAELARFLAARGPPGP